MKILSTILLVAGILAGPAYWVYAKFYTGSRVAMLNRERASPEAAAPWRSPAFELTPNMAPAGLVLHAQGRLSPGLDENKPPNDRYAATLSRDGEAAKPLAFTLGVKNAADSTPAFKEHLLFFQVVQGGRYNLEVTPATTPSIGIERMQLEVRQHLHEPDSRIVTAGMVVMILGILGFVI
jgi:hypothetical protein